jgi:hypothetical protein
MSDMNRTPEVNPRPFGIIPPPFIDKDPPSRDIKTIGTSNIMAWTVGGLAIALVFLVGFLTMGNWGHNAVAPAATSMNPNPAVLASPAPAAGVPAPPLETTTGQSLPVTPRAQ